MYYRLNGHLNLLNEYFPDEIKIKINSKKRYLCFDALENKNDLIVKGLTH